MQVTALHLYPVKGLAGSALGRVEMERCGFAGDRRWLVVDPSGRFITQRECGAMARIHAEQVPGGLVLRTLGLADIAVAIPAVDGEARMVTVWRSTIPATHADAAADQWLSRALGRRCALVYLSDPQARPVDPVYAEEGDRVSFADGFPVLLTAEVSLADLNRRLARPVPMDRFRANLVVAGTLPWEEDTWRRIRIGEVEFRLPKPCSRCAVPSIDQETGERPDPGEPLRTLASFRRTRQGVMFGQNLIPVQLGTIAVGDVVSVLKTGPSNVEAEAREEDHPVPTG